MPGGGAKRGNAYRVALWDLGAWVSLLCSWKHKCLESGRWRDLRGVAQANHPSRLSRQRVKVQLLNLFATREVVGYANLNQERR
jgi:hypothetical protein